MKLQPNTTRSTRPQIRPRKPIDYDNEIHGRESEDLGYEDDIVDFIGLLTKPDEVHSLWIKGRTDIRGGFFETNKPRLLAREALKHSGNAIGVHWSINPVRKELFEKTSTALNCGQGPPNDVDVLCRRILPIDIDPKRKSDISATKSEKDAARKKMRIVESFLSESGWPEPVVVDSGNGFYLLYRVDLPTDDGGLVKSILKKLGERFNDEEVTIDSSVANAGRVLRVPSTMACKGNSTNDRPHRRSRVISIPQAGLQNVPRAALQSLANASNSNIAHHQVPANVVMAAARSYIKTMPSATSGQGGHVATLKVATKIVVDFDLPPDSAAAQQLMSEYNARCNPPWKEKEWVRKLHQADENALKSGMVRGTCRPASKKCDAETKWEPLQGPDFLMEIPDFAILSKAIAQRTIKTVREVPFWSGLGNFLVWKTQRSAAVIPDIVAAQINWGAGRPVAWKRALRKHLGTLHKWTEKCKTYCPLFGSGLVHQHIRRKCVVSNGVLERFTPAALDVLGTDLSNIQVPPKLANKLMRKHRRYFLFSDNLDRTKIVQKLQKKGILLYTYLPILIFGRSRRLGLSPSQYCLMLGITRELTRVGREYHGKTEGGAPAFKKAYSARIDRADVIRHGKVHPPSGSHKITCPLLDERREYVVFGGNLPRHKGCGYRVISLTSRCWLSWAGYDTEDFSANGLGCIGQLFRDFVVLAEMFDLTVAALHSKTRTWKGLADLQADLRTGYGREWIQECTLRVFAPADYLLRWRYELSKRLGFGWIPGGECCSFGNQAVACDSIVANGSQLRSYLDEQKLTQGQLAKSLNLSRESVNRHISGKRNSAKFWSSLNRMIQGRERVQAR